MGGGADMMQEQITEVSETESMPKETAPQVIVYLTKN